MLLNVRIAQSTRLAKVQGARARGACGAWNVNRAARVLPGSPTERAVLWCPGPRLTGKAHMRAALLWRLGRPKSGNVAALALELKCALGARQLHFKICMQSSHAHDLVQRTWRALARAALAWQAVLSGEHGYVAMLGWRLKRSRAVRVRATQQSLCTRPGAWPVYEARAASRAQSERRGRRVGLGPRGGSRAP